jgi:peptidoglycan/xylan/chitin deacetylase (PgdA/CDA1 family)
VKARHVPRRARRWLRALPHRPTVLSYHRVATEAVDPWALAVSPERFADQLGWLRRHRQVMPLHEFARRLVADTLPRRALAITFDDGYACTAAIAAPLLAEHGLTATVFLATQAIVDERPFWWDELERLVLTWPGDTLHASVAGHRHDFALGPPDAFAIAWPAGEPPRHPRQHAFLALWSRLRNLDDAGRRAVLDELRVGHGGVAEPPANRRPMTVAEASTLTGFGLDVGVHTSSHAALPELSPEEQREEILRGREACAAIAGAPPTTLAYPYGAYDAASITVVRSLGFVAACTTDNAAVRRRSDPLRLPRLQVGEWSGRRLGRRLRMLP